MNWPVCGDFYFKTNCFSGV